MSANRAPQGQLIIAQGRVSEANDTLGHIPIAESAPCKGSSLDERNTHI